MHHPPSPSQPPRPAPARPRWLVPTGVLGAVVLLVAGVWAAGGFEEQPKQPDKLAGKPIDQKRFEVTVRDARIMTVKGIGVRAKPERFLAVRLRVVNKGKETASLGEGGLKAGLAARTKDGKWVKPDDVEGLIGEARTGAVQPGMPVEATAKWRVGPADAPRQFVVGLRKWEFESGFTDTGEQWRVEPEDKGYAGRLTLAVTGA